MVAGALGFVSGHVTKMDTTISLAIGGVSAIAGYIASKQDCTRRRKRLVKQTTEYEEEIEEEEEEVLVAVPTKKKKKKKKQTGKVPKQYKRSSYEEDVPAQPEPQKKEESTKDEYAGLSKGQIKKLKKKKREEERKLEEAKLAAEKKRQARKEKRKLKKKKMKEAQNEALTAQATAQQLEDQKKKDEEEGWLQPKEHIKRAAQKEEFERQRAQMEAKRTAPKAKSYIKVPGPLRGKVFGKKKENINNLQLKLGVKMTLPKPGGIHDVVEVEGPKEFCDKAIQAIQELMDKGFSTVINPGFSSAEVKIPEGKIGVIMGSGGKNFRDIYKITKVTSLEKDEDNKVITIIGPVASVMTAKEALEELSVQGYSKITHPTWIKAELQVSLDVVPAIIGKKGENIKRITKTTKTRIATPKNGSNICTVVGDEKHVKMAIELLNKIIEEQTTPKEPEPIPQEWQGKENHNEDDLWE